MNWRPVVFCATAFLAALWIQDRVPSKPIYQHDLRSAYGIVETASATVHGEELQRAMDFVEAGRFQDAESIYSSILAEDPKAYEVHHALGSALTYDKKYDQAEQEFRKALALAPTYAPSYSALGAIAAIRKDHENAITYYKKVLELDPKYGLAYWGLGIEFYKEHDCTDARMNFSRVPELLPGSEYARMSLDYAKRCSEAQS